MSSNPSAIGPDLRAALVAMVRKRVPESEVEDIVQATLADAIESPHAPTDSESLRRWIFGVAKNKVVDYHRRAGRETFELPEVPGKPAPHAEADLLRWAEKHLPPGEENKKTLDWMLREGEGEKLEWIAESEKVPAPRVRQRVSRLRRHLKTHWQKEVALLAALGVIAGILALVLRRPEPEPIANEDLPRAAEIRKEAFAKCLASEWRACLDKLDDAKKLDPAGDSRPEVRQARENAEKGLTLPPPAPTTNNITAPPPSSVPQLSPDSSVYPKDSPPPARKMPQKSIGPKSSDLMPTPVPTEAPKPQKAPPIFQKKTDGASNGSLEGSSFGNGKKQASVDKKSPGALDVVGYSDAKTASKKPAKPAPTSFGSSL
jgi:DNA-directed RNA polymerase specialized sigma24 family protein